MKIDVPTKSWVTSATVWFNILTIVAMVLAELVDANSGLSLPKDWVSYALQAQAIVNILLRVFKTNLPIGPDGGSKAVDVPLPKTVG